MKVLFLAATVGHGHIRSAEAIMKAFSTEMPQAETVLVDNLNVFSNSIFRHAWNNYYHEIFESFTTLPNLFENRPELLHSIRASSELRHYLEGIGSKNERNLPTSSTDSKHLSNGQLEASYRDELTAFLLAKYFEEFQPDVAVCTYWYPCKVISNLKLNAKINILLCAVAADFAIPLDFIQPCVDVYFVTAERVKYQLMEYGIPSDKIKITGASIDPVFAHHLNKNDLCREYGLKEHIPILLLLAGGLEAGAAKKILRNINELPYDVQTLVIASEQTLKQELETLAGADMGKAIQVFGYTNVMHEFLELADLVISKAGGMISAEVLAKHTPMIIVKPPDSTLMQGYIHYVELFNANFLLEEGCALEILGHKDFVYTNDIKYKISSVLKDSAKADRITLKMKTLAKSRAAFEIVDHITNIISKSAADRKQVREKDISNLLQDMCLYFNSTLLEMQRKIERGTVSLAREWNDRNPQTADEVLTFYKEAENYIFDLAFWHQLGGIQQQTQSIVKFCREEGLNQILDYGCGIGELSIALAEAGCNVTLADVSGKTFDFAKWRVKQKGLDVKLIDVIDDFPLIETYDCIVCLEVLEHLWDPTSMIKHFYSHLRLGGFLLVTATFEHTKLHPMHLVKNEIYSED